MHRNAVIIARRTLHIRTKIAHNERDPCVIPANRHWSKRCDSTLQFAAQFPPHKRTAQPCVSAPASVSHLIQAHRSTHRHISDLEKCQIARDRQVRSPNWSLLFAIAQPIYRKHMMYLLVNRHRVKPKISISRLDRCHMTPRAIALHSSRLLLFLKFSSSQYWTI